MVPDWSLPATPWQMYKMRVPLCLDPSNTFLTNDDNPNDYSPNHLIATILIKDGLGHVTIDRVRGRTSVTTWPADLWIVHVTLCFGKKATTDDSPDGYRASKGRKTSPNSTPSQAGKPSTPRFPKEAPLFSPRPVVSGPLHDDTAFGKKTKPRRNDSSPSAQRTAPAIPRAAKGTSDNVSHQPQTSTRTLPCQKPTGLAAACKRRSRTKESLN